MKRTSHLQNAPSFPSGLTWLQGRERTRAHKAKTLTLLVFWSASCLDSMRLLPVLQAWQKRYGGKGLEIVGVYVPEFSFESAEVAARAVEQADLSFPVVYDPEQVVAAAYKNHWWPRLMLVGASGSVLHDHVGRGGVHEVEAQIQSVLRRMGAKRVPKTFVEHVDLAVCHPTTPELFFGASRAGYANAHVEVGHVHTYRAPRRIADDTLVLEGDWLLTDGYAQSAGGSVLVRYMASSVHVVAGRGEASSVPAQIEVTLDGKALEHTHAGDDVGFVHGASVVHVDEPRLYAAVYQAEHHESGRPAPHLAG